MSNKILFLTPQLPFPPNHGSAIRNYNLICTLADRHTVDLLTFFVPENPLDGSNPLHEICRSVAVVPQPKRSNRLRALDTIRRRWPDMALRLESAEMHKLVRQWVVEEQHSTQYDVVQIEGIEMAQYALTILDAFESISLADGEKRVRPAIVFDDHNCEYLLQKRNALNDLRIPRRLPAAAYSIVQWQKLKWYESLVCRKVDAVTVVSYADKVAVQGLVSNADVTVVSNGISITDDSRSHAEELEARNTQRGKKLIFVGKMDYRPNVDAVLWFAEEVFPLIQAQEPTVTFDIVGMNPHDRLDTLRDRAGVSIVGKVAEIQPYLDAADVYVVPLRVGGGTRFKALEAMAASMSIVSTSLGVEGIPVEDEQELLIANTPTKFAEQVLRLLANEIEARALRKKLEQNGRHFVEERYSWGKIVPILEQVYARILLQNAD